MHAERITYAYPLQKHASVNYGQQCVSKIYKLYSVWTESPSFILNVCYYYIILTLRLLMSYIYIWSTYS